MSHCEIPLIPIRIEPHKEHKSVPATPRHGGCSGGCANCPNRAGKGKAKKR